MTRRERMIKQAEIRKKMKNRSPLYKVAPQEEIDKLLSVPLDKERFDSLQYKTETSIDIEVDSQEVEAILSELRDSFDKEQLDKLFKETKKDLIQSIIVPFGLGRIVGAYDKIGGNVDTIHNVRNDVYATDKAKETYDSQEKYNSDNYHKDYKFIEINKQASKEKKSGNATDYMTEKKINANAKTDLDHVVSAKEIHDDQGRILAGLDGTDLANREDNLKITSSTINRSKQANSMKDFLERKNKTTKEIKTLESKSTLSTREEKKLKKLKELNKIDDKKAIEADKKARKSIDKDINTAYYESEKFKKDLVHTGLNEGAKMGTQQAIGIIIMEFLTSAFSEIKEAYNRGLDGDSLYENIKKRLKRISANVMSKWKDIVKSFSKGFISGFISNIITVMINTLITTGKRVVRMIREGFFSLLKAFKLLLFPPENMTRKEAAHEAMKLFFAGGIIVAGVALEEVVEKFIMAIPILVPLASIITAVIVGSLTAIAMAIVTYLVDKSDILNVNRHKRNKYISNALDNKIESSLIESKVIVHNIDNLKWT